jgi:fimbrial chaperone protein
MRSWILGLLSATVIAVAMPAVALASSLQVAPVNIEVPAPGAASTITLKNSGKGSVNAQVRVFKWTQVDGKDQLVPTKEVVASPPAVKLGPGKSSVVRIVRRSKTPASTEESYRLVVDEVPKAPSVAQAGVGFAMRYSVPVFFSAPDQETDLSWTARIAGGQLRIVAENGGGRRIRLADLKVVKGGKSVSVGQGLAGYVLGESSHVWLVKGGAKLAGPGSTIKIIAKSDNGPIEATAKVVAAN